MKKGQCSRQDCPSKHVKHIDDVKRHSVENNFWNKPLKYPLSTSAKGFVPEIPFKKEPAVTSAHGKDMSHITTEPFLSSQKIQSTKASKNPELITKEKNMNSGRSSEVAGNHRVNFLKIATKSRYNSEHYSPPVSPKPNSQKSNSCIK